MPTRNTLLLSLVMILAVALSASVLALVNSDTASSALADAGSARQMQALSDQIAALGARLSAIEARADLPVRQPVAQARERDLEPARTDVAASVAETEGMDRLATRVAALEQRVMEAGIPDPWVAPPSGATARELRNAFDVLTERRSRVFGDGRSLLDSHRLDLCRRMLTADPNDPYWCRSMLEAIIQSARPAEARDALHELGGRAGFKEWEIMKLEARTFHGNSEGGQKRASLRAVADDAVAPSFERARALLQIGSSWRNANQSADALVVLRDLIAQYEATNECKGEVESARKLIQEIESAKR